jgi:hypothetical protein
MSFNSSISIGLLRFCSSGVTPVKSAPLHSLSL